MLKNILNLQYRSCCCQGATTFSIMAHRWTTFSILKCYINVCKLWQQNCTENIKDPECWMPPSFPGNVLVPPCSVPTEKYICKYLKISKFCQNHFLNKKTSLANSLWAIMNLPKVKFQVLTCPMNLAPFMPLRHSSKIKRLLLGAYDNIYFK